ncbi:MAG: hypothetical protein K2H21_02800 [Muribaculaceae bacterium]|nr:hypothetical protein [Muribaculaceae bacterium]
MIGEGILKAQRKLYERSAKLGEQVVVADENGQPIYISGEEALQRMNTSIHKKKE